MLPIRSPSPTSLYPTLLTQILLLHDSFLLFIHILKSMYKYKLFLEEFKIFEI